MGKKIDLTNQVFHKLKVIKETSNRDRRGGVVWLCQCECGTITEVSGSDLRSGHKKSCGCLQKEIAAKIGKNNLIDLTGEKYGLLTVIGLNETKKAPNGSTKSYWNCQCECGNIIVVNGNSLKQNNTKSCGCIKSLGEQKIAALLQDANINFVKEKIFPYTKFRFDFFVEEKYIIEYDGKQHFQDYSWGQESFTKEESQLRDRIKNEYCFKHNIPIIRIPYTHFNEIELKDLLLETSNFIIKPTITFETCRHCAWECACQFSEQNIRCDYYKFDPVDGGFYG